MGWFDSNDKLIRPPDNKELPNIVTATTSEAESFTIMDFNTGIALFETANDLEVLRVLPKALLVGLCLRMAHRVDNSTKESLKKLSKTLLINKLRDAVCYSPHSSMFCQLNVEKRE
jgi:hypothetical protein